MVFHLQKRGAEVYELMKTLLSALEGFRSGVNALHVSLTGELRVIASDTICMDPQSGLDYRPLYVDDCHLYCSRTHPLYHAKPSPQLLDQVLSSKVVHAGIHTSPEVGAQLADMNKAAISYFYEARLAMILSGAYIGFMPDAYVQRYVDEGDLRALVPQTKHYSLEICTITRTYGRAKRARELFGEHWVGV